MSDSATGQADMEQVETELQTNQQSSRASRSTLPLKGAVASVSRLLSKFDAGILLVTLLTLFIVQNLLQPVLPTTADLPIHLYRTLEYERAWAPGVTVPRWAPNLAYGYGYPLFLFAPPLPYLAGMASHNLGLTIENALKALIILTILLYAIGMYLLARDLLRRVEAGLIAAAAYAFAPFALREALLYGGNVPQFLAIGLFPWTLWAMSRAAGARRPWGWTVLAAILYAGVLLSHLFQALIFTPVVALFGLLLFFGPTAEAYRSAGAEENKKRAAPLPLRPGAPYHPLLTIPLGLLLSAFFWLPALVERTFTRAQADIYLEKSPFFVRYPHWTELIAWIGPLDARAANPYVPLALGVVTLILAGLGLLAALRLAIENRKSSPNSWRPVSFILFFGLVAAGSIFMTLPLSRPVWETVSMLQVAEFPWRMLGLANLGLAFLTGAALLLPPPKLQRPVAATSLLLLLLAVAPLLYPVTPFTRYGAATLADQIDYERRSQSIGTTTLGEYLPRTVTSPPTGSPLVETYQANQIPTRLDDNSLPPDASATLLEQTAVTHRYQLNSPTAFTLRFFQFHFPGWQATLDGQPLPIRPETESGLILVDLPAGQHSLQLRFGDTPIRLAAMLLSGLAGLGLLIAGFVRYRRSKTDEDQPAQTTAKLSLYPGAIVTVTILIAAAALWLKPALRPIFTIKSPPDRALPAQHHTDIAFANGIRLIGYDLSRRVVSPGGYLQVVLYWQTGSAPYTTNLQPFVHLDRLDDFSTIAGTTNYTPGDVTTESNLPTFHWDSARYVRDEHDFYLPPDVPPLAYAVRVGWIDPDQGGTLIPLANSREDTAHLTTINVAPQQQPAPLAEQLDVAFNHGDDTLQLTGFELVSLTPERLTFNLTWQTGQPLPTDYIIFAQLLDLNQNLAVGFDSPPVRGAYPTSTWLSEQTILDTRSLPVHRLPPGEYQLIAGLYDPATGQRLLTAAGADYIELTKVTID